MLEDVNSVGNQLEGIDGFGSLRVDIATGSGLGGEGLVLDGCKIVESNSIVSHDFTGGDSWDIEDLIGHQGKSMPITVLVDVAGRDVDQWAETGVDGLDRPLKLGQEDRVGADGGTLGLEPVYADEGEANSLDEDVVDFGVNEDVVGVQFHGGDLLGGVDVGS